MTKTEIKIKLRSLIKFGDFDLVEQLLEGLNEVSYFKYSIHVLDDLSNKGKSPKIVDTKSKVSFKERFDSYLKAQAELDKFYYKLQTKYNNMCAEAIETTESTGRE
tara:strand:+ start:1084 stop:1401 length:318 start_codon:yes stop_codon:yes gene_type:complete